MTIAYMMRYWPICGGGETVTATLANELIKRGHAVHILYTFRKDINPMPYLLDKRINEAMFNTIECSETNIAAIANYLMEQKVEVMINQWADYQLCYEVKKLLGIKLVTCWHMCLIDDHVRCQMPLTVKQKIYHKIMGESFYRKWWIRIHMNLHLKREKMCDLYVFLSDAYEREYVSLLGNRTVTTKLYSIPNPLTYNFDYNLCSYVNKKKEVLFVGRILERHKRLSYVLRIWKEIEADVELKDWSLRIVGDGDDMQTTQDFSRKLGLQRISSEGFKDPRQYYEQASIIMMTSAKEGFPMVLVESQQYAVVPIAMDSFSALHDIIQDGENGIIISNNDIPGFVAGMKKLMLNDNFRNRLAQGGLKSCKRYNVDNVVDKWETLLNGLMALGS